MQTDRECVQRVLVLDDRAAYSDLVRKYQVEVRTYLLRMTRNRELADDLAQDSFLLGYRQLRHLNDGSKFRPWIYSIARNQFLQFYRSQKHTSSTSVESSVAETSVSARAEVESLLRTLRPEESSVVILCLGHDFTHSEAAEALKIPLGTVKSLVLRAKQKLGEQENG